MWVDEKLVKQFRPCSQTISSGRGIPKYYSVRYNQKQMIISILFFYIHFHSTHKKQEKTDQTDSSQIKQDFLHITLFHYWSIINIRSNSNRHRRIRAQTRGSQTIFSSILTFCSFWQSSIRSSCSYSPLSFLSFSFTKYFYLFLQK